MKTLVAIQWWMLFMGPSYLAGSHFLRMPKAEKLANSPLKRRQPLAEKMAAVVATGANAHQLPPDRRGTTKPTAPGDRPRPMDGIAEGACQVLTAYIRAVRQYALNAQGGDGQGMMAKVLEALTKINAGTKRLNRRIDTIEKTTNTPYRQRTSAPH